MAFPSITTLNPSNHRSSAYMFNPAQEQASSGDEKKREHIKKDSWPSLEVSGTEKP